MEGLFPSSATVLNVLMHVCLNDNNHRHTRQFYSQFRAKMMRSDHSYFLENGTHKIVAGKNLENLLPNLIADIWHERDLVLFIYVK